MVSGSTRPACATETTRSRSRIVSLNSRGGTSVTGMVRQVPAWTKVTSSRVASSASAAVPAPPSREHQAVIFSAWKVRPKPTSKSATQPRPVNSPAARRASTCWPAYRRGGRPVAGLGGGGHVELAEQLPERLPSLRGEQLVLQLRPFAAGQQVDRVRDAQRGAVQRARSERPGPAAPGGRRREAGDALVGDEGQGAQHGREYRVGAAVRRTRRARTARR